MLYVNSGSLSVHSENHGNDTGRVGGSDEPSTTTNTTISASASMSASSDPQGSLCEGFADRSTASNLVTGKGLKVTDAAQEAGRLSNVSYYSEMWTSTALPSAAEVFDDNKIIIAFEDRRVRIILLQFTNNDRLAVAPCVLFDFQNQLNIFSAVQRLYVCPWVTRTTQSTTFELIAHSAADNSVSHWRLKLRDGMILPLESDKGSSRDSSIRFQDPESVPVPEYVQCRRVRENE